MVHLPSNTLKKIFIILCLAIVVLLVGMSVAFYFGYRNVSVNRAYEYNQRAVRQINSNFEKMNEIVIGQIFGKFNDADIVRLMYSAEPLSSFEQQKIINKFKVELDSLPMFHSYVIYNDNRKEFYTVGTTQTAVGGIMNSLRSERLMTLRPMPYDIREETYGNNSIVFSYSLYEEYAERTSTPNGVLVLNVNVDWVFDAIRDAESADTRFMIADRQGRLIFDGENEDLFMTKINNPHIIKTIESITGYDSLSTEISNGSVITGQLLSNTDFILLCEQPVEMFQSAAEFARDYAGPITVVGLIIALIMVLLLVNVFYVFSNKKSIENVKKVFGGDKIGSDVKLSAQSGNMFGILIEASDGEMLENFDTRMLENYIVAPYEPVRLSENEIIVFVPDKNNGKRRLFLEKSYSLQQRFKQGGEPISLFVTNAYDSSDINGVYKEIQLLLKYKIIYSSGCCLTMEVIQENHEVNEYHYSYPIANKLLIALLEKDIEKAENYFDDLLAVLIKNDADNFVISLMRLALSIQNLYDETNMTQDAERRVELSEISKSILDVKRMDEVKYYFGKLFSLVVSGGEKQKGIPLAGLVVDYIHKSCTDPNMSLKLISDVYKISKSHLARVFKEAYGVSVGDYINFARLDKSIELLKNSSFSIRDIIEKTGFSNESNYYKLFKKRFGITPKEYRLTNTLTNNTKE